MRPATLRNSTFGCLLLLASSAHATDFYISSTGLDSNRGTSPAEGWRTVQRVNSGRYAPGDRILFEGGATFSGNLFLDATDGGTPAAPITIGSYGNGRATIYAGDGTGILIVNAAGFVIRDLFIIGSGSTTNTGDGIFFFTDLVGDVKLPFIWIDHVDTARFGDYGILIGSNSGNTGYRDVRITFTISSDNAMGGLFTYAQNRNVHENVYIGNTSAFRNSGKAGLLFNSGNGITLSSVNGAIVERSVAHDNGWLSDANNGPIGIWAFNSTRVTLQFNESYHNLAVLKDGGGFGFDVNTSLSVMQYNYSHDNVGAGYQLAHSPDNFVHTGSVIRYNISENDGRNHEYAGIQLYGRILNAEIYNNTVFVSPRTGTTSGVPRGILVKNSSSIALLDPQHVHFRNNIIQTTGGVRLIEVQPTALDGAIDLVFEGNDYFSTGGTFKVLWGATTYASLEAWRAATGQERANGVAVGLSVDPEFLKPNAHITFNNAGMLPGLYAYRLKASSLLIDAGVDLRARGVDPGTRDYFGGVTPVNGRFDIGAHEYRVSCNWGISPTSASATATAESTGMLAVTAADVDCGWAAQSTVEWMGISQGEMGGGNGSVSYWVAANPTSSPRTGRITIADQTFTLTQPAGVVTDPGGGGGGSGGTNTAEVVLYASTAPVIIGSWSVVSDVTAAGGARLQNPNAGAAKITTPLASPADYFEMTFFATAAQPYHLWIRGKATADLFANDSVHVQFDGSVDASGAPMARIGSTQSAEVNIEDCSGCGLAGWGWQDNGYGVMGANIYFATTGTQRIRVQVREDGLGIDQIGLSPARNLSASPGTLKNDTVILPASDGSGASTPPPPPPAPGGDVVLYASTAPTVIGAWSVVPDATAAGGARLQNPNTAAAKIVTASQSPVDYFELTFDADAGTPYHLWIRGKATSNAYSNDSVHVQFSDSVTASGVAFARIGTTQSAEVNLEDCSGCGLSGWGWQDNGYGVGVMGPDIFFATTGRHTIRIQVREDGLGIDQVVLSPSTYLTKSPGALKNDTTILAR